MTLAEDLDRFRSDTALRGMAFADAWRGAVEPWLAEKFEVATAEVGAEGLSLVAIGGFGRGDLAPASDLDLLLLHRSKMPPAQVAENLWYPIWDEGLKLGHAVRTVAEALELAGEDLDTATSLLSCRHLAGDAELTAELATLARAQWRKKAKRYLGILRTSVAARQEQAGEVAFLLEPDLKVAAVGCEIYTRSGGLSRPVGCLRTAIPKRWLRLSTCCSMPGWSFTGSVSGPPSG